MFTRRRAGAHSAKTTRRAVAAALTLALCAPLASCGEKPDDVLIGVPDSGRGTDGGPRLDADLINPLAIEYIDELKDIRENTPTVATKHVAASQRIAQLREGKISMTFGCVGELLDELDPAKGQQLREMYAEEENPDRAKWRDITHSTMLSALPADLVGGNPGMAMICGDDSLPQNIVALWRKPQPDRYELRASNNVAGGVSTEKLRAIAEGEEDAE